jgi:hypothetical protein
LGAWGLKELGWAEEEGEEGKEEVVGCDGRIVFVVAAAAVPGARESSKLAVQTRRAALE